MRIIIPAILNSQEVKNWKQGLYFKNQETYYKCGKYTINIHFNKFNPPIIIITGYNNICYGKFELSNGWYKNEECYPVMYFYNKLSMTLYGNWDISDTLTTRVNFNKLPDGTLELTELNLFNAFEKSFNKIFNF